MLKFPPKIANFYNFLMENSVTSGGLRPPDPPAPVLILFFQKRNKIIKIILIFNKLLIKYRFLSTDLCKISCFFLLNSFV